MEGLEGKVAVVVGGASGIGRATSIRLAHEGAKVVVSDISADGANQVAEEIRHENGLSAAFTADISSDADMKALAQFAVEEFGGISLLHNVAADLALGMTEDSDILGASMDTFDKTLAVTLRGYVLACRVALPHIIAGGGGAIVNTSSLVAQR